MRALGHPAPDAQSEAVALNFDAYTPQQIAKRVAGNIVGGSGLVALVYYLVFRASSKQRIDNDRGHRARAAR